MSRKKKFFQSTFIQAIKINVNNTTLIHCTSIFRDHKPIDYAHESTDFGFVETSSIPNNNNVTYAHFTRQSSRNYTCAKCIMKKNDKTAKSLPNLHFSAIVRVHPSAKTFPGRVSHTICEIVIAFVYSTSRMCNTQKFP